MTIEKDQSWPCPMKEKQNWNSSNCNKVENRFIFNLQLSKQSSCKFQFPKNLPWHSWLQMHANGVHFSNDGHLLVSHNQDKRHDDKTNSDKLKHDENVGVDEEDQALKR